jgi:GTP-binding protein
MADGVLLLVDASEGPLPQTRFVLEKALGHGLKPIVVINKVDRQDSRIDDVYDEIFELFVELGAPDEVLDFPTIYACAREGWATADMDEKSESLAPLLDAIIEHIPHPEISTEEDLQMLVTTLDYSEYIGRIAIGKVHAGKIHQDERVTVINKDKAQTKQKVLELYHFEGLGRKKVDMVKAGDLCAVAGLDPVNIGDTIADFENPKMLTPIKVDEPTLNMTFRINDGPFSGQDGKYVTSSQLSARLERELRSNVALRVELTGKGEEFRVAGRGLMHIGILLENMRREGYELCVMKPKVIFKTIKDRIHEPVETMVVTCPADCQSAVMSLIGNRRAELVKLETRSTGTSYLYMEFRIPARGLIGLSGKMLTATRGRAVMYHNFFRYEPMKGDIPQRQNGVMIASHTGQVTSYALDALYDRGFFFVKPGEKVYEGQIVGEHTRDKDILVNVVRTKHLSNIRSTSKDEAAKIRPARELTLEAALEFIQDDDMVEVTPKAIRLRKVILSESMRVRDARRRKTKS